MSSTTSFYEPKSLISDKPSTDVETADSQFCDKETVTDYADDLDYNHEHEDEEYNATSRGLTVVFKVPCCPSVNLEPWTGRTHETLASRWLMYHIWSCRIWNTLFAIRQTENQILVF